MKFSTIRTLVAVCATAALSTFAHADSTLDGTLKGLSNWNLLPGDSNFSFASLSEKAGTKFAFTLAGENTTWNPSQTFSITDGAKSVLIFAGIDTDGATKNYTVASQLNGITFASNSKDTGQVAPGGINTDFHVYQSKTNANLYAFAYEDFKVDPYVDYNDMVVTMQVTPVPEPETYALMLGGLGVLGLLSRRRLKA